MASAAKVGREGLQASISAFKKWQRKAAKKEADKKRQQAHKQRVASEAKEGTERGRFQRGSHPSRSEVEGARLDPTTKGSVNTARTLEKRIRDGQEKVATGSRTRIERVTPEVAPDSRDIQRLLRKERKGTLTKNEKKNLAKWRRAGEEEVETRPKRVRQAAAERKRPVVSHKQITAQKEIDAFEKKIRNNQKMSDSDWNKYNRLHKTINETPSKKDAIHALTQYGEILPGFDPTEKQVKSALTNLKARGMNKKLREMVAVAEQMGMTGLVTFKGSRGVPGTVARNIEPKPGTPRRKRLTGKQAEKKAIARKRGPAQGRQLTRASGQKKQGRGVGIRSEDRKIGGTVMKKKHGGMTHVGLSPAEMSRSGTMSEAKRARYMQAGGPIHTTFSKRADPRKGRAPAVDLFPEVGRFAGGATALPEITKLLKRKAEQAGAKRKKSQEKKKKIDKDLVSTKNGGKVGKKKQGYKDRKDESIAMRVKKKRTPKQLKASRHESYGKPGSGKGKGKINRVSSKQTDGNKLVASLYD